MFKYPPISKSVITARLIDIKEALGELECFKKMTFQEFRKGKVNYALASFWLQRALEATLSIGTHIIARLPKTETRGALDYSSILPILARHKIVSQQFAQKNAQMGSYRNRLVHQYYKVDEKEIYSIIREHFSDFLKFSDYVEKMIKNPKKYELEVE